MGPYAVVDYNLALSRLQSRLKHIYPWATLCQSRPKPMPETTLCSSQGLRIWPQNRLERGGGRG
jgi:hypothetical protein